MPRPPGAGTPMGHRATYVPDHFYQLPTTTETRARCTRVLDVTDDGWPIVCGLPLGRHLHATHKPIRPLEPEDGP